MKNHTISLKAHLLAAVRQPQMLAMLPPFLRGSILFLYVPLIAADGGSCEKNSGNYKRIPGRRPYICAYRDNFPGIHPLDNDNCGRTGSAWPLHDIGDAGKRMEKVDIGNGSDTCPRVRYRDNTQYYSWVAGLGLLRIQISSLWADMSALCFVLAGIVHPRQRSLQSGAKKGIQQVELFPEFTNSSTKLHIRSVASG